MDISEKKDALKKRLAQLEDRKKYLSEKAALIKKQLDELARPGPHLTAKQQTQVKILYGDACMELCKSDPVFAERVQKFLDEKTKNKTYRRLLGFSQKDEKISLKNDEKNSFVRTPVFARERIALTATFEEKEQVKALGATWDGKTWGVPIGADLRQFEKWLPPEVNLTTYGLI